jgi:Flp pilus assembly protein TadD
VTLPTGPKGPGGPTDAADAKHWAEVEESSELLHDGQVVEALTALRDVVKASPTNPYAFHLLGIALFEAGELEAARDAYRAALTLAPMYLGARVHLSHVLRMLKDVRGAIQQGEEARRQAPQDPEVWHALGMAHAQRGDREAARRYLEAYLGSSPEIEVAAEVRAVLAQIGPRRDDDEDAD